MKKLVRPRTGKVWSTKLILVVVTTIVISIGNLYSSGKTEPYDKFEKIRAYIQVWLSKPGIEKTIISSSYLKVKIVDDWGNQSKNYQIVSVRKPDDYINAGHIPFAINTYWIDILTDNSLAQFDFNKTQILYCYYGHGSMITYTILSLLGYKCNSLDFGMMDWNLDALVKKPWDKEADYDVETTRNTPQELYHPPTITCEESDVKDIIKEMAIKYLAGEGSPVILSSDVKAIVDNWEQKNIAYQIVDVRSKRDYETAHVPHSINIPLTKIAEIDNLKKLDPNRPVIVYSENGQTGQLAATVLSLLGYHAVNMLFGMMDWNKVYVEKSKLWDGSADYPVEQKKSVR